jgi:hypothetical protein
MHAANGDLRGPLQSRGRHGKWELGCLLIALALAACNSSDSSTGGNRAPVADAGPAQSVAIGATVTLDGSKSTDPDRDLITYQWSFASKPAGSGATLSSPVAVKPAFVADVAGSYVLRLVVSDGSLPSDPAATVTITAAVGNVAPVARAGDNQYVTTNTVVTLDGSKSSDANGDLITYQWSFVSKPDGSGATLSSATAAMPTFTPDVAGSYVVQLVVSDGKLSSALASVTVNASIANSPPVADAGQDQNKTLLIGASGVAVTLDGSHSSDANNDKISYQWTLSSRPSGSTATLSGATTVNPSFTADLPGDYVAKLVVFDGKDYSTSAATVTVHVSKENSVPVADAGTGQSVTLPVGASGVDVTLDGSKSSDADGDQITYRWALSSKPAGSAAALNDATLAKPTFTADLPGDYVFKLVVNDGKADSTNDATVTVKVSLGNSPPIAKAGAAQNVTVGTEVTLDGSGSSDADNNPLTYLWTLTSSPDGSTAALIGPTTVQPTFTPDQPGSYVFKLVVNDGTVDSNEDTVIVTASAANSAPVANAGPDQSVIAGASVQLDGSASSDADGNPLTFKWHIQSVPPGSNLSDAALSDATNKPTFTTTLDAPGNYVVQLVVNDGTVDSNVATVTITATPRTMVPWKPTSTAFSNYNLAGTPSQGTSTNFNLTGTTPVKLTSAVSNPPLTFLSKSAGNLRLYDLDDVNFAINYNGSSGADAPAPGWADQAVIPSATMTAVTRYISMPYVATTGPVTLRVYYTWSGNNTCGTSGTDPCCANGQLLIVKADRTIVKAKNMCDATGGTQSYAEVTFIDPVNTELFVLFARNGDTTGGPRLWEMDLTK